MNDIVLVNPPISFLETQRGQNSKKKDGKNKEFLSYPPLGVLYLASSLEKEGIKVCVIDAPTLGIGVDEIVDMIKKENTTIVGISATTPQTRTAVSLAKLLGQEYGNSLVIGLGGAHISADPDFIKQFPFFDFGFVGQGEITFPKIVKRILCGEIVNGIIEGEAPTNLDEVSFPARHLIDMSLYFMPIHVKKFTSIIASRGCPYNCLYCSRPVIGKHISYRSVKNIINEIEKCKKKYGIEWFQFVDDTMTLNRGHIFELCHEIINKKIGIEWGCQTRVDLVDKRLLEVMYQSGCREMSFGIESGNERVRSFLNKNFSNETVLNAFQMCKKVGIETNAFMMLGLPTEKEAEMNQTIKFACKIPVNYVEFNLTTPFPGSELFDYSVKNGVVGKDIWNKFANGEIKDLPNYITNEFGKEELQSKQKQAYKKFYFRPEYILQRIVEDIHSIDKIKRDVKIAATLLN